MTKSTLGVGVIGTGFGGLVHVPAWMRTEGCTVIGVASRDPMHAQKIAEEHDLSTVFATWQELLASPDIDIVSIATPPLSHEEIVSAAIAAGKSILCEKPFSVSVDSADRLCKKAAKAGITHGMNFVFRELPALRYLKQCMDGERAAGRALRHVSIQWTTGSWANPERPWAWQNDADQFGGILTALVVHVVDYVEWLFGDIQSLSAVTDIAVKHRTDASGTKRDVTAPDHCHLLLQLAGGIPVTCTVSQVTPRAPGHHIEVHGERDTWLIGSDSVTDYARQFRAWSGTIGSSEFTEHILDSLPIKEGEDGRIALMAEHTRRFSNAMRSGAPFEPSFVHGARSRLLLEAIEQASRERRWVDTARASG